MPVVALPNGDSVTFPEGMSGEEMGAAIESAFPNLSKKAAPAAPAAPATPDTSTNDVLGLGGGLLNDGTQGAASDKSKSVLERYQPTAQDQAAATSKRLGYGAGPISAETAAKADLVRSGMANPDKATPLVKRVAKAMQDQSKPKAATSTLGQTVEAMKADENPSPTPNPIGDQIASDQDQGYDTKSVGDILAGAQQAPAPEANRSVSEILSDAALGVVAKGINATIAIPVNLVAPGSEYASMLKWNEGEIADNESDVLKKMRADRSENLSKHESGTMKYASYLYDTLTNPTLALQDSLEVVPFVLGGMGAAKLTSAATAGAVSVLSKYAPKAFSVLADMATDLSVSGKAIEQGAAVAGATAGGTGYGAAMVSSQVRGEVYSTLMDPAKTTLSAWTQNPDYQGLLAKGVSSDDAIRQIAESKSRVAAIAAAPLGAIGFFGAKSAMVANSLAKSGVQNIAKEGVSSIMAKELLTNSAMMGGQRVATNAAIQGVNGSQDLTEGLPEALGAAITTGIPLAAHAAMGDHARPDTTTSGADPAYINQKAVDALSTPNPDSPQLNPPTLADPTQTHTIIPPTAVSDVQPPPAIPTRETATAAIPTATTVDAAVDAFKTATAVETSTNAGLAADQTSVGAVDDGVAKTLQSIRALTPDQIIAGDIPAASATESSTPTIKFTENPSGTVTVHADPETVATLAPGVPGIPSANGVTFGVSYAQGVIKKIGEANVRSSEAVRLPVDQGNGGLEESGDQGISGPAGVQGLDGRAVQQALRQDTQARLDRLNEDRIAKGLEPNPKIVLGDPDPKTVDQVNEIGQQILSAFGTKADIVPYHDDNPESANGFAFGGRVFLNTYGLQLDATHVGFHEVHHILEAMAQVNDQKGLTGTASQKYRDSMNELFSQMTDQGRANYVKNFLFKGEINAYRESLIKQGVSGGDLATKVAERVTELASDPKTRSEMVADFVGNRGNDRESIIALAKADPVGFGSFAKKWVGILSDLISTLRGNGGNKESLAVDGYMKDLAAAKLKWQDAMIELKRNGTLDVSQEPGGESPVESAKEDPAAGVYAEVAPDPRNEEAKAKWDALDDAGKDEVHKNILNDAARTVFSDMDLKGWGVEHTTGMYEKGVNPSGFIKAPPGTSPEQLSEVARVFGKVLDQKGMVAFDEGNTTSGSQAGFVKVVLPEGIDQGRINEIRKAIAEKVPQADGDTLRDGALVFGNFSEHNDNVPTISDQQFHDAILAAANEMPEDLQVTQPVRFHSEYIQGDWGDKYDPKARDGYLEGTRYASDIKTTEAGGDDLRGRSGSDAARSRLDRLAEATDRKYAKYVDYAGRATEERRSAAASRAPADAQGAIEYGRATPDSVSAVGHHFSQQRRTTLSSAFFGTGLKGLERERLSEPANSDIKPRVNFYVDKGKGVTPEEGVGGVKHTVKLNNLYDTKADPLGIVKNVRGENAADRASKIERMVKDHGFDGYLADTGGHQNFAVLVGKHDIKLSRRQSIDDINDLGHFNLDGNDKKDDLDFPELEHMTLAEKREALARELREEQARQQLVDKARAKAQKLRPVAEISPKEFRDAGLFPESILPFGEATEDLDGMIKIPVGPGLDGRFQEIMKEPTGEGYDASTSGTFVGSGAKPDKQGAIDFVKRMIGAMALAKTDVDLNNAYRKKTIDNLASVWRKIAEQDNVFKLKTEDHSGNGFDDIAKDLGAFDGYQLRLEDYGGSFGIEFKRGGRTFEAHITEGRDNMECCTMGLAGSKVGTEFYAVAGEYARRNNMRFLADQTLSAINTYRRTEQALSFALKSGDTAVMIPGVQNRVYGFNIKASTQAEHDQNIARLALAGMRNAQEIIPDIRRYSYDPKTDTFLDSNGENANDQIGELLASRNARAFGLGRTTLARAMLTSEIIKGNFTEDSVSGFANPIMYSLREADSEKPMDERWGSEGNPTPEFKKFFEGTKVVDENGNPKAVFHGSTSKGVKEFDTTRVTKRSSNGDVPGTYFTSDPRVAYGYTREFGSRDRGEVVSAFLKIENPLNTTADIARFQKQGMSFGDAKRKALESLTDEHDGIIFDGNGMNSPEYVVFKPEQIKSVFNANPTSDPRIDYAKKQGPDELKYEHNYLVPEIDGFEGGNIAHMPAIVFARDGIKRTFPEMPVRMRVGEHMRNSTDPIISQYGVQHRIENQQKDPQSRGYATPKLEGKTEATVERAAREITLGVLDAKTAYADSSPSKIYLHAPGSDRSTVLEMKTDSVGQKFWSVVTSMPSTREQMMRRYKAPTSVAGITFNGDRTQQSVDIKRGMLDKLQAPGQSPNTSESYILDEDNRLFKQGVAETPKAEVSTRPVRKITRDENGRLVLSRPQMSLRQYSGPGSDAVQAGFKVLDSAKEMASSLLDDTLMKVSPMSLGTDEARATAKDYANAERLARWQWAKFDETLKAKYSDADRKKMWEAADEENVLLQQGLPTTGLGLDTLTPSQRATMDVLHQYGEELLQRAKDVGMFQGDGLPYWTPRMAVMIDSEGEYSKPPGDGKQATNDGKGRNVTTSSGNLKQRKYLTADETEAAMQAKLGADAVLVKDIRTMPLAMAKLERAIAGRELVNKIKEIGKATGNQTVSTSAGPGFFTVDHPAFTTFKPRMITDDQDKVTPALDQNGNMVFDKTPIFISKDFEGPLKSILSDQSGDLYKGLMTLKGKAMGLIMYSPLIHNAVEWGRAMPMMPGKVLTFRVYFDGNKIKNDPVQMAEAIKDGMVPIGHRGGIQDITGLMEDPELAPGRSWTAKLLGGAIGAVHEGAGEAVKKGVDAAGDFWHNTLLWDRVGDLQAGIYGNIKDDLIGKGMDAGMAGKLAAHFANRYAGALPNEAMSANARKIANVVLFSRSFTIGNLGVMKDMVTGLPKDVQSQIKLEAGEASLAIGKSYARRKAWAAFVLDIALLYAGNSMLQSAFDKLKRDKSLGEIEQGYVDRFHAMLAKVKEDPTQLLHPFDTISSLTPNSENEPGKEDRIHYGNEDNGTAIYMRLPTGKIGEEFKNWMTSPLDTLLRKQGTFMRPVLQTIENDKGFGQRVYDKDAKGYTGLFKNAGRIAWNLMSQQLPMDSITAAQDWSAGRADSTDKMKVVGPLAGLTFSRGAPGGPAVGEMFNENRIHQGKVADVMPDAHRALKLGDEDKARALLESADMTPKEINAIILKYDNPETRLYKGMRNYNKHASDEPKARMEKLRQ